MGALERPLNANDPYLKYCRDRHEFTNWAYCYLKEWDLMISRHRTVVAFRRAIAEVRGEQDNLLSHFVRETLRERRR